MARLFPRHFCCRRCGRKKSPRFGREATKSDIPRKPESACNIWHSVIGETWLQIRPVQVSQSREINHVGRQGRCKRSWFCESAGVGTHNDRQRCSRQRNAQGRGLPMARTQHGHRKVVQVAEVSRRPGSLDFKRIDEASTMELAELRFVFANNNYVRNPNDETRRSV